MHASASYPAAPPRRLAARTLAFAALAAASTWALPARAADVGVSISISQPGVYGRVDIGRFPVPRVIVPQPVIVRPVVVRPQSLYVWVPPGHRRQWSKHCAAYGACGAPVYFVDHRGYHHHVHAGPGRHGHGHGKRHGHGGRDRDDD